MDIQKEIKEGLKVSTSWYKSVIAFTSIVYLVSSFILYSGTLLFPKGFAPARIYGMVDGEHPHLQRTAGVLLFFMAIINVLPLIVKDYAIIIVSIVFNVLLFVHYFIETYVFWSLRVEFMTIIFVVLLLNGYWAAKEFVVRQIQKKE